MPWKVDHENPPRRLLMPGQQANVFHLHLSTAVIEDLRRESGEFETTAKRRTVRGCTTKRKLHLKETHRERVSWNNLYMRTNNPVLQRILLIKVKLQ